MGRCDWAKEWADRVGISHGSLLSDNNMDGWMEYGCLGFSRFHRACVCVCALGV